MARSKLHNIPTVVLALDRNYVFGREILRGVVEYARLYGPWAFYTAREEREEAAAILNYIEKLKPQGAISNDSKLGYKIYRLGIPTIFASNISIEPIKNAPRFIVDNESAVKLAVEHFTNRGFYNFAYCGYKNCWWAEERGRIFKKMMAEAGFEVSIHYEANIQKEGFLREKQKILVNWLRSLPKHVGLLAGNDQIGQEVAEMCKIAGIRVPDEIAILGVDNDELICELTDPPMSSVALAAKEAGHQVACQLDKMMQGKEISAQEIIVKPTYVVSRQSTNIIATEDKLVAEAIQFINVNYTRLIQVSDVISELAVSRRCLEQKFKKVVGRSIHEEIIRVRIEQIAKLLVETDLPIHQIAAKFGYTSLDNHMSRCFRAEKKMTPQAYRKKFQLEHTSRIMSLHDINIDK